MYSKFVVKSKYTDHVIGRFSSGSFALGSLIKNTTLPRLPQLLSVKVIQKQLPTPVHRGFAHASHGLTRFHSRFPRFLPRLPYFPRSLSWIPRNHGRDRGIISAILAVARYFFRKGFCIKILIFPNCFFFKIFLILHHSVINKEKVI